MTDGGKGLASSLLLTRAQWPEPRLPGCHRQAFSWALALPVLYFSHQPLSYLLIIANKKPLIYETEFCAHSPKGLQGALLSLLREYNLSMTLCLSFPRHGKLVFLLLVNQIFVLHKVFEAISVDGWHLEGAQGTVATGITNGFFCL